MLKRLSQRSILRFAPTIVFFLVVMPTPAAAKCGEIHRAVPSRSVTNPPPLAIGDSVLADTVPLLAAAGFEADGMVCRTLDQGLVMLRARASTLPSLVVLALGTNGTVSDGQVRTALATLGPTRRLALVTPHHGDTPDTAAVVRAEAARYPSRILLLDWDQLSTPHPEWFASDGTHLGGSSGIRAFASMVTGSLQYAGAQAPRPSGLFGSSGLASAQRHRRLPSLRKAQPPAPSSVGAAPALSAQPQRTTAPHPAPSYVRAERSSAHPYAIAGILAAALLLAAGVLRAGQLRRERASVASLMVTSVMPGPREWAGPLQSANASCPPASAAELGQPPSET